jgi:hypothetical protein
MEDTNQTVSYGYVNHVVEHRFVSFFPPTIVFNGTFNLVTLKKANVTLSGLALGEVIAVPSDPLVIDNSQAFILQRNAILSLLIEPERTAPQANIVITKNAIVGWTFVGSGIIRDTLTDFQFIFKVVEGDLKPGSLTLFFDMPDVYNFIGATYTAYITINSDTPISTTFTIGAGDTVSINIGAVVPSAIIQNSIIKVDLLDVRVRNPSLFSTDCPAWILTLNFLRQDESAGSAENTVYQRVPSFIQSNPYC